MTTTRYVAMFLYPGMFFAKSSLKDLGEPADLDAALAEAWPENAYAARLDRWDEVKVNGETFTKTTEMPGTIYRSDTIVDTADDACRRPSCSAILRSNIRCNGWSHVAWQSGHRWPQPFNPSLDRVLARKEQTA